MQTRTSPNLEEFRKSREQIELNKQNECEKKWKKEQQQRELKAKRARQQHRNDCNALRKKINRRIS